MRFKDSCASTVRHAWPAHALNELYMDGVAAKVARVRNTIFTCRLR